MKTIFHATMEHATVTFLTYDALKDFLSPMTMKMLSIGVVVSESKVSDEDYDRMSAWKDANK